MGPPAAQMRTTAISPPRYGPLPGASRGENDGSDPGPGPSAGPGSSGGGGGCADDDDDYAWLCRLEDLRAYKSRCGHCDVPRSSREDRSLGRWVNRQRAEYARFVRGGRPGPGGGVMTEEKVVLLEGLGFKWTTERDDTELARRAATDAERETDSIQRRGAKEKAASTDEAAAAKEEVGGKKRRPPRESRGDADGVGDDEYDDDDADAQPRSPDGETAGDADGTDARPRRRRRPRWRGSADGANPARGDCV